MQQKILTKQNALKILAVDTATEACSAALIIGSEKIERYRVAPREHSLLILGMVEAVLKEADLSLNQLDALAFGRGPGSFTGVRIATGIIQGLALAVDRPVVPISTLAAMAQICFSKYNENTVFSALDARMEEVYWGVYEKSEDGFPSLVGDETVTHSEQVRFPENARGVGAGSGWHSYQSELTKRLGRSVIDIDSQCLPSAGAIAELAVNGFLSDQGVAAEQAIPVYLRDQVAKKKKNTI